MVFASKTMVFVATTMLFVVPTVVFVFKTMVFAVMTTVFVATPMVFVVPTKVFFVTTMVSDFSTMVFVVMTTVFITLTMVFTTLTTVFFVPTMVFVFSTTVFGVGEIDEFARRFCPIHKHFGLANSTETIRTRLGTASTVALKAPASNTPWGSVSIKIYDKFSLILRIEPTVNDDTFFKHYREAENISWLCLAKS